jgi:uncharacterized membrane protein YtjA (UPF0391 family)
MFILIALVAGFFGLTGLAGAAVWLAWFTLAFCGVMLVVMLLSGGLSSLSSAQPQGYTDDRRAID